jgi:hypothetical protein
MWLMVAAIVATLVMSTASVAQTAHLGESNWRSSLTMAAQRPVDDASFIDGLT